MSNAPYLEDNEFKKYLDNDKYKSKVRLVTILKGMTAAEGVDIPIKDIGHSKVHSANASIRQFLKNKFPKETFHIKVIDNENIRVWRLI